MSARYEAARGSFACPVCGMPNDAADQVGGDPAAVPGPGDVLVCIGCAEPAIVGADGTLQPAPPEVRNDPDVRRVAQIIVASSYLPTPPAPGASS
jgi:hypothetical protein